MIVHRKVSATNVPAVTGSHGIPVCSGPIPVFGSSGTLGDGGPSASARMTGSGNAVRLDDRREEDDDDC